MTYQIDQSGKIEDTSKPTVLAMTNGQTYSILIPAKTKREIQEIYRRLGLTRFYIYEIFSLGLYFLLTPLKEEEISEEISRAFLRIKKTGGRLRECFPTLVGARPQSYVKRISQKDKKSR